MPDFLGAIDPGPGMTSPESGDTLAVSDFVSDIDPGSGEPLLESGDSLDMSHFTSNCELLQVQDFVGAIDPGPGTTFWRELPDKTDCNKVTIIIIIGWLGTTSGTNLWRHHLLAMPDFVSDNDPGPGDPLLESAVGLDVPHFASDCDILQMQECVYAINPGHGETSPESRDILTVSDVVSNLFGSGGQIPVDRNSDSCHSVMCTSPPDPGGDYVSSLSVHPVFARFTIMMIIVTLLQSVLSGSLRQKFAPRSLCRRKFVSPEVCAGIRSCAEPSDYDDYCDFIAVGLVREFAPGSLCRRKCVPEVVPGHPGAPVL